MSIDIVAGVGYVIAAVDEKGVVVRAWADYDYSQDAVRQVRQHFAAADPRMTDDRWFSGFCRRLRQHAQRRIDRLRRSCRRKARLPQA